MSVIINPILESFHPDSGVIGQIAEIAMENFSGFRGRGLPLDRRKAQENIRANLKSFPSVQYFTALVPAVDEFHSMPIEEEIVGYISSEQLGGPNRLDGEVWEIKRLAVKKSYQGQGIDSRLINSSLPVIRTRIRARGSWLRKVLVFTGAENPVQKIYASTLQAKVQSNLGKIFRGDEVVMIAEFPESEE